MSDWAVVYKSGVRKSLRKIDSVQRERIKDYIENRVAGQANPRLLGKPLKGDRHRDLWRYRVGDYRVLAQIVDERFVILVVKAGHRRNVYD